MLLLVRLLKLIPSGPVLDNGKSGGSGKSTTVTVSTPVVNAKAVVMEFESDNIGDTTFGSRTVNFTGSLTEFEKKVAKQAYSLLSEKPHNERKVFHVTVTGDKASVIVFTTFSHPPGADGKAGPLDIHGIGNPKTSLPDAAKVKTIEARLTGQNITLDGFSGKNESKIVKMALNALTDDELAKMKDVRYASGGAKPGTDVGGQYDQSGHVVLIFDFGLEDGDKMVLGTDPADLLPNGAHSVIHEAGHVIAYNEIRQLELDDQKKRKAFTDLLTKMEAEYPDHIQVTRDDDGEVTGFTFDHPNNVDASKREAYKKDVEELKKRHKAADEANKKLAAKKQSKVMEEFSKDTKSEPAPTPYSRKESVAAGKDDELKIKAKEEVFAEAFSIHKWDKDWLGANRPKMKTFLDGKKHLQ
jgi:hypothetical protein